MEQQVLITTDLGYGDAGKGTMVDALVHKQETELVVRYSGGAQAAHNVVTPDGRHHTFAQFGSGSFKPGVKTYLGPQVLVQPQFLLAEANALQKLGVQSPLSLMTIDERAPIITPYHQLVNRLKELARGTGRHGSTGIGIGETRADSEDDLVTHLTAGDLLQSGVKEQLAAIREQKRESMVSLLQANANNSAIIDLWHQFNNDDLLEESIKSYTKLVQEVHITDSTTLQKALHSGKHVIFEAAQGTLLDEDYGFFPHVTRGKVTTIHAHELLTEVGHTEQAYVLGIVRAYAARHGPGAFPTENAWLRSQIHEQHNAHGDWQGAFRMGHFDMVATDYAIRVNGKIDGIAVTSIDQLERMESFHFASKYRDPTGAEYEKLTLPEKGNLDELEKLSNWLMQGVSPLYERAPISAAAITSVISDRLSTPVVAISQGVTREDKMFFNEAVRCAA